VGQFNVSPTPLSRTRNPARPLVEENKSENTRTKNILSFRPDSIYTCLSSPPPALGDIKYNDYGELAPQVLFSPQEFISFIYNHRLHQRDSYGQLDRKNSKLRLWVQRVPSDSARRYKDPQASYCRFKNCFSGNKLRVGQFRIAIDELSHMNTMTGHEPTTNVARCSDGTGLSSELRIKHENGYNQEDRHSGILMDPFINAGYVHLFCAENLLNLPAIIHDCNIRAEARSLPLEPGKNNRMALDTGVTQVAREFIQACEELSSCTLVTNIPPTSFCASSTSSSSSRPEFRASTADHIRPLNYPFHISNHQTGTLELFQHCGSLTQRLHERKAQDEPPIRKRTRADRNGGVEPERYDGNLKKMEREQAFRKKRKAGD
jgi:hypothetical protein